MQLNEIVEKLKQGQSGVVDFKIKNNPIILTAASLEKAKNNDISFLDNNSQLNLKNLIKTSKASALLLPADDDYIIEIIEKSGHETQLILLSAVNYYNGQYYDIESISKKAKENLEKAIDVLGNDGAEAIILGCTEITLAIKRTQHDSLPLINTTKILATALLLETKPDAINIE